MKESSVYQDFVHKGELRAARQLVLRAATRHLGEPPVSIRSRIETVTDLEWLFRAHDRALEAATWDELIADAPEPKTNGDESV